MRGWWIIAILLLPGEGLGGVLEVLHPGLTRIRTELASSRKRLAELPLLPFSGTTSRLGFHSETMSTVGEPLIIQLDLQGTYPIEQIALVPVGIPTGQGTLNGYGFPAAFEVTASLEESFAEKTVVADCWPGSGRYPVLIDLRKTLARYVRMEINRHGQLANQSVSALGEIMVFSAGRNVALHRPAKVVFGRPMSVPPTWDVSNLTDGESLVGPPVDGEKSSTRGFRSADTNSNPWVQVDLGRSHSVDEIRLIPARFAAQADTPGYGFPVRFEIQAGYDATFGEHQILSDQAKKEFPNPGENPFVLRLDGRQFRFIRVAVHETWRRGSSSVFALSELQVFSGAKNVALHAAVTASGEKKEDQEWGWSFLTDGFSSRYRLVDRIDQITMFAERENLEIHIEDLEAELQQQLSKTLSLLTFGGGALIVLLLLAIFALRLRHRRAAQQATRELRAQIAGDLHDDVGSNLGSIALLAQSGDGSAAKLREIEETARETAESMRDIVWMLKSGNSNTGELLRQMGAVAKRAESVNFNQSAERSEIELPLKFTRHVFLAFKEAIANARKHAQAEQINVRVEMTNQSLAFEVADDGTGFDTSSPANGNGLGNLRDRAGAIGAELVIESAIEKGTRVKLRATLPRS